MMKIYFVSVMNLLYYTTEYFTHYCSLASCWIIPDYSCLPNDKFDLASDNQSNYFLDMYKRYQNNGIPSVNLSII